MTDADKCYPVPMQLLHEIDGIPAAVREFCRAHAIVTAEQAANALLALLCEQSTSQQADGDLDVAELEAALAALPAGTVCHLVGQVTTPPMGVPILSGPDETPPSDEGGRQKPEDTAPACREKDNT